MVKIIMHGCNGHMGQVISGIVEKDPDAEIVAGIDIADQGKNSYPVFTDIDACQVEADAIIDFSSAKATDKLLEYSAARQIPVVLCSTGLSQEQLAKVEETSRKVAVLKSANMSLGINTLLKLVQDAAKVLAAAGFDMEIGISAVRGGTIVGEHEIIFAGQDEVIEFKHTAYSKAIFGKGAVEAAKFLAGKPAGRYDMSDVIG